MTIIRKVRNEKSQSLFTQIGNVELPPSTVVDLYEKLTDDRLLEIQLELQILRDRGSITVIEEDAELDLKAGGSENITGTIIATNDNATSFRLRGPNHASEGGTNVQSYAGMFYNDGYDTLGTLKTRASYGANLEMDLVFQSPHALILMAADNTQADGKLVSVSKTNFEFHMRTDPEVVSPKQLIVDRVDTGSVGTANTSDINLKTNSGSLYINNGVTDGALVFPTLTETQRDALTGVAGMVVYNTTSNKLNFYNGTAWEAVTSA